MNHLFLALFLLDVLETLALTVVLHFLGHYAASVAYRHLAWAFALFGLFLISWFAAAYLAVNLYHRNNPLLGALGATAYLFVCAAEAVLVDLLLGSLAPRPPARWASGAVYGVFALVLFSAKLFGSPLPGGTPLLFYAKWGVALLLLIGAVGIAATLVVTGGLGELRFPRAFRVLLGGSFILLCLAGASDLLLVRARFRGVEPLAMSYPFSAATYLLVAAFLLAAALHLIDRYRSLLPRVEAAVGGLLTAREREILSRLLRGESNRTIADRLFIAVPTVKNHLHAIYEKLGVSSRAETLHLFLSDK